MKTAHWNKITGLLCAAGLFAVLHLAHAQTTSDTGSAVTTDPDADVSNLSDLEVELKALEMATPLAASNIPASGNFYSAQHAPGSAIPWPPLPGNIFQMSAWPLDTNIFVLDDLNFDYNDASVKTSKTTTSVVAKDDLEGPPTPPGGGGSDTNTPSPEVNEMPNYGTNLYFSQFGMVSNNLTGIASNTLAVEYAVQTNSDLTTTNWADNGQFIQGSDVTNWTQFILPPPLSTNNLFFRLQSQLSSDGSGIPNWWELKYLGTTSGINPNAQDSAGDGYTIYQKYEMGLNPNIFYTPTAPQGVNVTYDSTTGTATITWLPSPGDVTGYTITDAEGNTYNVTGDSFTETIPYSPDFEYYSAGVPSLQNSFQVEAHYANGSSAPSAPVSLQPPTVFGSVIPGPSGGNVLAVANIPENAAKVRVFMFYTGAYVANNQENTFTIVTNVDIPVSNFTNGIAPAYSSWFNLAVMPSDPYYVWHYFYLQSVDTNGNVSGASPLTENWGPDNFYDGREQLKQNLTFQFRVADTISPFGFISFTNYPYIGYSGTTTRVSNPMAYAYAAFYDDHNYNAMYGTVLDVPTFDIYRPFADNVLYRNFVYTPSDVDANGNMTTGVQLNNFLDDGTNLDLSQLPTYSPTTNTVSAPLLGSAEYLCNYSAGMVGDDYVHDYGCDGFSYDNDGNFGLDFTNNVINYWGLPFVSAEVYYADGNTGDNENTVLNAGGSLDYVGVNAIYMNTTQPKYRTVEYDFWDDNFYGGAVLDGAYGLFYDAAGTTNLPGNSAFSPTNTSAPLMVGVGQNIGIAAFAKMEVTNSAYTSVYGYVQQYLTNAYQLDTNGYVTTNLTGIVSPYGNYFATQAGAAAVVTMPDPDTGQQGTDVVYAVSLNVDKNHDGTMDLSWNGPDATSQSSPMEFWINNDNDGTGIGQDINAPNFPDSASDTIQSMRGLEDFTRLWICGVPALPADYQVTLSWANISSGNPSIKIFPSRESDGGTEYLTETNLAQYYVDNSLTEPCFGTVTNGENFQFPVLYFTTGGTKHLIYEGASAGAGELTLTITDNKGNTIAQTGVWLDLHDIKDFYEQAIITNNISGSISNWTSAVATVQPAISSGLGNDTNLIVFVHGFNVGYWDWLTDSDTVFKRLYWAGYQGKFFTVKWPAVPLSLWNAISQNTSIFNDSEIESYKAGSALKSYLSEVRTRFPDDQLNVLAHSQGNAIMGEAIEQGAPFDTYILTQGAMPGSSYDVNAPLNSSLTTAQSIYPTPEWQPMGYHGAYTNMTGKIVSYFNPNDSVLGIWLVDQAAGKPDGYANHLVSSLAPYYSYDGANGYYNGILSGIFYSYLVSDPEESRAMISRSLTGPVGRETTAGVINSTINLGTQFGFTTGIPEHSAEWTRPIQTSLSYYVQILNTIEP
jgi:hypothetical protein